MNSVRRRLAVLAAACAFAAVAPADAQGWPTKAVRIVVPFPAAGTTDIVARAVGAELQKMWGQSVVIDNRPGASGNIGAELVARAPADGYTFLILSPNFVTNPSLTVSVGSPDPDCARTLTGAVTIRRPSASAIDRRLLSISTWLLHEALLIE